MKAAILIHFFVFISLCCNAQLNFIKGKVIDAKTKEPLAFVNIVINEARKGTTTRIDGTFSYTSSLPIETIQFSYVGYDPVKIIPDNYSVQNPNVDFKNLTIRLNSQIKALKEVDILAGENPAHRIIRLAAKNKKKNNPEKIKSFSYKSYNKFFVTGLEESDSVPKVKRDSTVVADSEKTKDNEESFGINFDEDEEKESKKKRNNNSKGKKGANDEEEEEPEENNEEEEMELDEFLEDKHLFLMESVTERKYLFPDRSKEMVLANRVSGLKNPMFTTMANSFQPFSFYDDQIKIMFKTYLNPISKGSFKKYYFTLEDSIYKDQDTVYVISFEPKNLNFEGLKGFLYINTNGYAIQNVKAEAANKEQTFVIRIQQQYELLHGQFWFPQQLNTDMIIQDPEAEENEGVKGVGRSYLSDIRIEPEKNGKREIRGRDFNRDAIEFAPDANKRKDEYWAQYRVEPLQPKDLETYTFIDSIGKEAKLDRFMAGVSMLTSGKLPLGYLQLDLNRIVNFNLYEGLRLGGGLHTSKKLSNAFNLGGYFAYGTKDKAFKYGGDINFFLTKRNDLTFSLLYSNDVFESGGTSFYLDNNLLSSETYRSILIENMDKVERKEARLSFYTLKYLDVQVGFSQVNKKVTTSYQFLNTEGGNEISSTPQNEFNFTELKVGLKYSFREKYVQLLGNKISTGTKYPLVWLNLYKGFDGILEGEFDYTKLDFKVQKTFTFHRFGEPSFQVSGGYVIDGNLPYTDLFNIRGSYTSSDWFQLEAVNSFQTMQMNEFLSDKYIALFYTHKLFKATIKRRKSEPEFYLTSAAGFGELSNQEQHLNYPFKTMEKGFYESGLIIKDIYRIAFAGLGVGGFYRYGPYGFDSFSDNLAIKLSLTFKLL
ncbi:DUF5686 and carboxypeptidase-like regulatory domain-containing protein [Flexithrix dorotheae]|uniref:DUF5686 and carboxypeptidase-like regulatory domain-containing protein n=1 Tax=Flexithrix dorotheae TaxID=70993 RepID=UPI00036A8B17|nr:DUF5686 and carboxypeptidase-like regulatory domain-containing protein [Flexithrix dorotheae]